MGTIFIAGVYGVGKSTLCTLMSEELGLPSFSAGDIISNINGEKYGANKAVSDKIKNQSILSIEVAKILRITPRIILAGHFCIFDKSNHIEIIQHDVYEDLQIEQILLLEADPLKIVSNLNKRDKKEYQLVQVEELLQEERKEAEKVSKELGCALHIHKMSFGQYDLIQCCKYLTSEDGLYENFA